MKLKIEKKSLRIYVDIANFVVSNLNMYSAVTPNYNLRHDHLNSVLKSLWPWEALL